MASIARPKRAKSEIATRANKLGLRERTMLIMVDDKTTRAGLLAKNAHPTSEGILNSLLADGYIEIDGRHGSEAATGAPRQPAAAPPLRHRAARSGGLHECRPARYACRALVTYLGPSADDLTAMIEKAKERRRTRARPSRNAATSSRPGREAESRGVLDRCQRTPAQGLICGKLGAEFEGPAHSVADAAMRILLAEDDRIISQGLIAALRKSGYAVDHVNNGADADTALLSQQYDLLILDLGLPRLSGIEVLKRLRGRKNTTTRSWC
jgi:hypothetical protein